MDTNIIVDTREPHSMYKKIMDHKELQPDHDKLDYGDYIVAGWLIERKTTSDFIGSVIDKRLWNQVDGLRYYTKYKPALLIEGSWGYVLKSRGFNYNQVYGIMNSITIDYGIPIIRTSSKKKTIEYFVRLVKKYGGLINEHHSIREKGLKDKSLSYQQRFVLEGFPGFGAIKTTRLLKESKTLSSVLNHFITRDKESLLTTKEWNKMDELLYHNFDEDDV